MVIIVIPIYKKTPSENDVISLRQTNRVLGNHYPIAFVCPDDLEVSGYEKLIPKASFIRLQATHFQGISAYNRLLTSPFFYKIFKKYKYILICQTDVYVFKNELKEWCEKGFDYIGSPWLIPPPQVKEKVFFDLNKYVVGKVGNGGFSLRKTNTFYRLSFFTSLIYKIFPKNEDFIWCFLIPKIYPLMRFPTADEALPFAFELLPSECYEKLGHLPFAVHAWEKYEPDFWKEFVR